MSPVVPAVIIVVSAPLSTWLTLKAGKKYGAAPTVIGTTAITAALVLIGLAIEPTVTTTLKEREIT